MTVILDPGHGIETPGKRSPVWPDGSQLFEWEFTRDVVRRIEKKLTLKDITSSIIVPEARDISLRTRVARINALYKEHPDSFLISVHGNAGKGYGWEAFTSKGQTESDIIATFLYTQAKIWLPNYKLRCDYTDNDPDKEENFYILYNSKCPAVLTENLFYDEYDQCQFMLSSYGREIIANLHVMAIEKYLEVVEKRKGRSNEYV